MTREELDEYQKDGKPQKELSKTSKNILRTGCILMLAILFMFLIAILLGLGRLGYWFVTN